MENRALIALALSFAIFVFFLYFGQKIHKPVPTGAPAPQAEVKPASPPPAAPPPPQAARPAPSPPRPTHPSRDITVETSLYKAVFSEQGGALKSFELKKYRESMPFTVLKQFNLGPVHFEVERYQDPEKVGAQPKQLVRVKPGQGLPLAISWSGEKLKVPGDIPYQASKPALTLQPGQTASLKFTGVSPEGLVFTKNFTFKSDSYAFDLAIKVENRGKQPQEGQLDLDLVANYAGEETSRFNFLGFHASVNNKIDQIQTGNLKKSKTFVGKVDWAGLDEGFFMTAMVPLAAPKSVLTVKEEQPGLMDLVLKTQEKLAPGQDTSLTYTLYFGPKDLSDLKALNLGLDKAVDFGWFHFLAVPLLYILNFFDKYVHNYGWAIIILTIIIRVLFFYPNHKSYKSMKDMQKLQPKVAKLREKYKDDKETMNKELMALYRTFKVNPLAGCLPMVIQLPFFLALYNVLGYAIELRHQPFIPTLPFTDIVWLADLSTKDPLLITPIVMGATMFIQQKMTPTTGDPTQAKMMMFLPLIFTFMFLNFASGLVIYWLVNNVLSIVQQYYTNKYLT
ncbi:MAG: membrane protein insertase YidC [Syntrophales bacterium]|nr:membrane protein insertase YidC [Syntrophales bacterium]MDD5642532.1 membrane protein insertase YidC [Syntrophales bacterium]